MRRRLVMVSQDLVLSRVRVTEQGCKLPKILGREPDPFFPDLLVIVFPSQHGHVLTFLWQEGILEFQMNSI